MEQGTELNSSNKNGLIDRMMGVLKTKQQNQGELFGKTVGFLWEAKSPQGFNDPTICIVQIEKNENGVKVTICDSHDQFGTSVMNMIEDIASGVYLENLAEDYKPDQVSFVHRTQIIAPSSEYEWGNMALEMRWNAAENRFDNPDWGQWTPDFEVKNEERAFMQTLRLKAAVAIEDYMRKNHEEGRVTPREHELYDRYQDHVLGKSERYRYNINGGKIFESPKA